MYITEPTNEPKQSHAERFDALLEKLLSVPKEEILKREAKYKKERASKKLRKT